MVILFFCRSYSFEVNKNFKTHIAELSIYTQNFFMTTWMFLEAVLILTHQSKPAWNFHHNSGGKNHVFDVVGLEDH